MIETAKKETELPAKAAPFNHYVVWEVNILLAATGEPDGTTDMDWRLEIQTIKQVDAYLQVTEWTVRRFTTCEGIPAFKVGCSSRFSRGDLDHRIPSRIGKASATDNEWGGMSASATSLHTRDNSGRGAAVFAAERFDTRDTSK